MTSTEFRALNTWALPLSWMAAHLGNRPVALRTWQHWHNGRNGQDVQVPDDVCADLARVNRALHTALKN